VSRIAARISSPREAVEHLEVLDALLRGEHLLVRVGELDAALLARPLVHVVDEALVPRTGRLGELVLQRLEVDVGGSAVGQPHHDVEPGHDGLGDQRRVLHRDPAEPLAEDLLDPVSRGGGVAVAGQVDEAVHEPVPRVAVAEHPHLATLAEGRDPLDDRVQLVRARVQERITRVRVQRGQERLVAVALGAVAGAVQDLDRLGHEDRDPRDRFGVRGRRQDARRTAARR
jgi:hypothetical protein